MSDFEKQIWAATYAAAFAQHGSAKRAFDFADSAVEDLRDEQARRARARVENERFVKRHTSGVPKERKG